MSFENRRLAKHIRGGLRRGRISVRSFVVAIAWTSATFEHTWTSVAAFAGVGASRTVSDLRVTSGENEEGEPRERNRLERFGLAFRFQSPARFAVTCGAPVNAAAASRARRTVGGPRVAFGLRHRSPSVDVERRSARKHVPRVITSPPSLRRRGSANGGSGETTHEANDKTNERRREGDISDGRTCEPTRGDGIVREGGDRRATETEFARGEETRVASGHRSREKTRERVPIPRKESLEKTRSLDAPLQCSGSAVPRSRFALISLVCWPNARSIFLLKCSLRSLMCVTSRSS